MGQGHVALLQRMSGAVRHTACELFTATPFLTHQPHQLQTPPAPSTETWPHLWDLQGTEVLKYLVFLPVSVRTRVIFAVARKGHGQDPEAILH